MFRFVAIVWNAADATTANAASRLAGRLLADPSWRLVYHKPGLRVLCAGNQLDSNDTYELRTDRGIIVGKLFKHPTGTDTSAVTVTDIDPHTASEIVRTRGKKLVTDYWGRYVAFLREDGSRVFVLRDPLGTYPCYTTRSDDLQIFFSRTEDILGIGLPPFTINWDYLAASIARYAVECRYTALDQVHQVLGGETVDASSPNLSSRRVWDPHEVASSTIEDHEVARRMLRMSVLSCVRAWVSCYRGVLLRLSGGLDSSILSVACHERTDTNAPPVTCLTYFSSGADADERRYARIAASAGNHELVELERDSSFSFEPMLEMARTPIPTFYVDYLGNTRRESELARVRGASAIFTGTGGDQVFYRGGTVNTAIDFARSHGVRPSLVQVALHSARLAETTIWAALRAVARDRVISRATANALDEHLPRRMLVADEVMQQVYTDERFVHPALALRSSKVLPGKAEQLAGLVFPVEYYNPFERESDPEILHPLLSQPLVETALSIPTYVLAGGGWDRALARRAFAAHLPREIVRRRSKGTEQNHYNALLSRNLSLVKSTLLEGKLVERKILNRARLETFLSQELTRIEGSAVQLHDYFGIEVWLRRWATAETSTPHVATDNGSFRVVDSQAAAQ